MQHRTRALVSAVLLVSAIPLLHLLAQQPAKSEEPESAAAMKAKATFLKEMEKIESDATDKLIAAQKKYAADLDEARKDAITKGDLNEAQRILTTKTAVLAADPILSSKRLTIISAKYGTEGKWADVTTQVSKMVQNNKLMNGVTKGHIDGFPDPAFGKVKVLVITYSVGNKVHIAIQGPDNVLQIPEPEAKAEK